MTLTELDRLHADLLARERVLDVAHPLLLRRVVYGMAAFWTAMAALVAAFR